MTERMPDPLAATGPIQPVQAPHRFSSVDLGEVMPRAITARHEGVLDVNTNVVTAVPPIEVPEPGLFMRAWLAVRRKTRADYEADYRAGSLRLQQYWGDRANYPLATMVTGEPGFNEEAIERQVMGAERFYRLTTRTMAAGALAAITTVGVLTFATTGTKYLPNPPGVPEIAPPPLFGGEPLFGSDETADSAQQPAKAAETGPASVPLPTPGSLPPIPGQPLPADVMVPLQWPEFPGQGSGPEETSVTPAPSSSPISTPTPSNPQTTTETTPPTEPTPTSEESTSVEPPPDPLPEPQPSESQPPQEEAPAG